jgi:hypothetical protein
VEASVDEVSEGPPQKKKDADGGNQTLQNGKLTITKLYVRLGSHINKRGGGGGIPAKKAKPIDCSSCFYKYTLNFDDASRAQICKDYNALSYERQKDMLLYVVKRCEIVWKRERTGDGRGKNWRNSYFFIKMMRTFDFAKISSKGHYVSVTGLLTLHSLKSQN